jgi:hypothetical protein
LSTIHVTIGICRINSASVVVARSCSSRIGEIDDRRVERQAGLAADHMTEDLDRELAAGARLPPRDHPVDEAAVTIVLEDRRAPQRIGVDIAIEIERENFVHAVVTEHHDDRRVGR